MEYTDYELYQILETNGYKTSEKNLDILKEGLESERYDIISEEYDEDDYDDNEETIIYEDAEFSDYELYKILEEAGYKTTEKNLSIIRELYDSGKIEIIMTESLNEGMRFSLNRSSRIERRGQINLANAERKRALAVAKAKLKRWKNAVKKGETPIERFDDTDYQDAIGQAQKAYKASVGAANTGHQDRVIVRDHDTGLLYSKKDQRRIADNTGETQKRIKAMQDKEAELKAAAHLNRTRERLSRPSLLQRIRSVFRKNPKSDAGAGVVKNIEPTTPGAEVETYNKPGAGAVKNTGFTIPGAGSGSEPEKKQAAPAAEAPKKKAPAKKAAKPAAPSTEGKKPVPETPKPNGDAGLAAPVKPEGSTPKPKKKPAIPDAKKPSKGKGSGKPVASGAPVGTPDPSHVTPVHTFKESVDYSDYDLYKLLESNGYKTTEANLEILKEGLESGRYYLED